MTVQGYVKVAYWLKALRGDRMEVGLFSEHYRECVAWYFGLWEYAPVKTLTRGEDVRDRG